MVRLKLDYFLAFKVAADDVPLGTPKRDEKVITRFKSMTDKMNVDDYSEMISTEIDIGEEFKQKLFHIEDKRMFNCLLTLCDKSSSHFVESDDGQIFLPKEKSCHGEPIILKKTSGNLYKGTKCVIFSLKGTKNSLSFVGRCQNESCQKKFYPFYVDNKIDDLIVRKYYKPEKYFGTTNETIFEIDLLNLMLSMLFHCTAEFHNIAYSLNEMIFNEGFNIEQQLLKDYFFTFQIAKILPELPMTVKRDSTKHL